MRAWEEFLVKEEQELGAEVVEKWLKPLKILKFDAGNLYLEAKDYFQALWFEEHIRPKAETSLVNGTNRQIKIHLSIENVDARPSNAKTKKKKNEGKETATPSFSLTFDHLNPYCTLENFFPTKANQVSFEILCEAVGYNPSTKKTVKKATEGCAFNPIYLHGASGTGKTHLLIALAHTLKQQGLDVIYTRAETFTEHVVSAIRAGEMSVFRHSYRHIDVLLIDDVHLFSRKGATQEELFHTFNTLHLAGKQIILGANCAPHQLQLIEPRLVSRFEWGIALSLEPAKGEELVQILTKKSNALNFPLSPKVTQFLIESFRTPKAMIKAVEALMLRSHLNSSTTASPGLSLTTAKQHLADLLIDEEKHALTPEKIIQSVGEFYGVRSEDILGTSQSREYVLPRQISMYFCRNELNMPFMKIGELFSRDHSTVMASVKRILKETENNKELHSIVGTLTNKLQS